MQSKHIKKMKQVSKTICKDGVSLLAFSDPKQAEATFKAMKKDGKECDMQEDGEGNKILVQYWEGKTAHQVADIFEAEAKGMMEKYKKIMNVSYSRDYYK